jgi:hypothetical protein
MAALHGQRVREFPSAGGSRFDGGLSTLRRFGTM